MKNIFIIIAIMVSLMSSTMVQAFDFGGLVNSALGSSKNKPTEQTQSTQASQSNLSNGTVVNGLKEALSHGVTFAVSKLSKEGGYLNDPAVKIPLPDKFAKAETLIRKAGGGKYVDNLILSMNKAASKAAPKTATIFANTVKNISMKDGQKILMGKDTAATQYLEDHAGPSLTSAIKPIVKETMQENNVAKYYNALNRFYQKHLQSRVESSGIMSMAKKFGADKYLPSASDKSLDDYVTQKAMKGLFKMIALKEASIRKNPVAQTTSLLKRVFGH